MNKLDSISRSDFLKLTGYGLMGMFLPENRLGLRDPNIDRSKPEIKLELNDLPQWVQEIWSYKPQLRIGESGRLELDSNKPLPVPLIQSYINRVNIKHAETISDAFLFKDDPEGFTLHYVDETAEQAALMAPHGTAEESARYIGVNVRSKSVAFLIGNKPCAVDDTLRDPLAILQMELPYKGRWAESANALYKTYKADGGELNNPYLQIQNMLTEKYGLPKREPRDGDYFRHRNATLLQSMSAAASSDIGIPNKKTLGIEVIGGKFHLAERYPTPAKIANTLAVLLGTGEKYGISGLNILGHYELDSKRGDPGAEFLYQMRLLYGLGCLIGDNPRAREATFSPFIGATNSPSPYTDYFNFQTELFSKSRIGQDRSFEEVNQRLRPDLINRAIWKVIDKQ